jgi:hypothetical protein
VAAFDSAERRHALRETCDAAWIWRIGAHDAHDYRFLDRCRSNDRTCARRMYHDETEEAPRSATALPLRRGLGGCEIFV